MKEPQTIQEAKQRLRDLGVPEKTISEVALLGRLLGTVIRAEEHNKPVPLGVIWASFKLKMRRYRPFASRRLPSSVQSCADPIAVPDDAA